MAYTVLIHLANADLIVADVDELPDPRDQFIAVNNPRQRDGKDVPNLEQDIQTLIFPWHRINFVEVMPTEEEEEIVGFVRE